MSNSYVEPWQPEVGSRVRYVYRAECPGVYGIIASESHIPDLDGALGTVYGIDSYPESHRVLVWFDEGSAARACQCAVLELAPVSQNPHPLNK